MNILGLRAQCLAGRIPIRPDECKQVLGLGVCAVLIEGGLLMILGLERPATYVPEFISYYLLTSIPYICACWLVVGSGESNLRPASVRWIWVAALVFRVSVAPLDPSLSEDTVRYRWLGMLQDAGGDPYLAIPEDPDWSELQDETWQRVAGKDKPSAYGPVVEQVNLWYYRAVGGWTADPWKQAWLFKFPFALADVLVGLALMALLSAVGRPPAWALIYLWSPLAITEFWIEGHNDAVAMLFVVTALTLSQKERPAWALASLALATMCKFWPAVLLPFLILTKAGRRWKVQWGGTLVFVAVALAVCIPYWESMAAVREVLRGFSAGWRNNDSLFALFLELARGDMYIASEISKWTLLTFVAVVRFLPLRPLAGELAATCALLLVSANCLPWYLTWMLPLMAVNPVAPILLWGALVSLAYHVVPGYEANGTWTYDPVLVLLEYAPVLIWLGVVGTRRVLRLLETRSGRPEGEGSAGEQPLVRPPERER